jgi:hypothetical protein
MSGVLQALMRLRFSLGSSSKIPGMASNPSSKRTREKPRAA